MERKRHFRIITTAAVLAVIVAAFGVLVAADRTPPAAPPKAGDERKVGDMVFAYIPSGSFIMGSPTGTGYSDNEYPQHRVQISSFWMGKYEVTQKQYRDLMGDNAPFEYSKQGDSLPVDNMMWNEAVRYCEKFSSKYKVKARLPTEAEWEYACRAGSTTEYFWGDMVNDEYVWYYRNTKNMINPVGKKKPNPWGLYDMSGNVYEWCSDWYQPHYYSVSPANNPQGPKEGVEEDEARVLRSGQWTREESFRSASRTYGHLDSRFSPGGLRVVISDK